MSIIIGGSTHIKSLLEIQPGESVWEEETVFRGDVPKKVLSVM